MPIVVWIISAVAVRVVHRLVLLLASKEGSWRI
jgi:hypothetical protein